jgi:hypothetical protein
MDKGSPKKNKAFNPKDDKIPKKTHDPTGFDHMSFVWRVNDSYMDYDHDNFGWCNCNSLNLLKYIIKELQTYEGLTWSVVKGYSHCHSWDINDAPKHFQDRLIERNLHVDELFQISIGSLCRIWGFRKIQTFYPIWYDPDHEGYKTKAR